MLDAVYQEVDESVAEKQQRIEDALTLAKSGVVKGGNVLQQYPCEIVRTEKNYYEVGGIEVIDYIKAKLTPEQYKGYLLGNIYKYSGRCQYKGEYSKDLKKLKEYTDWLHEHDANT